jgi:UDP:flavonoid glycosyltransferase YjiC (YdhE family)
VGINLKTNVPTVEQVRDAVREVMTHPQYAQRAKAIQADLAKQDAVANAAGLLEELARKRRPVTVLSA